MLPLLCLTKSTMTTRESFVATLSRIGFTVVARKESPKVAFFCLKTARPGGLLPGFETRLSNDGKGASARSTEARLSSGERAQATKGHARKRNRGANDFAVYP